MTVEDDGSSWVGGLQGEEPQKGGERAGRGREVFLGYYTDIVGSVESSVSHT